MINWFDMPDEGLSNGGLFEIKELEVTENGTYEQSGEMYNKVTVNVEGGGGSSDFSTAEVTFINGENAGVIYGAFMTEGQIDCMYDYYTHGNSAQLVITSDGTIIMDGDNTFASTTGAIEDLGKGKYLITGDCTITIS